MLFLQALPQDLLERILWFLPQQLLINLALTNYYFYEPCLKQLYKNLLIQTNPVLHPPKETATSSRRIDFIDLAKSTICGFSLVSRSTAAHLKLLEAKLQTLLNSLKINPKLAMYIETIQTRGTFSRSIETVLSQIVMFVSSVPNSIHKVYIGDKRLRKRLGYHAWKSQLALKSITIDDLDDLRHVDGNLATVTELIVAATGSSTLIAPSAIPIFEKLEALLVRDELETYSVFTGALWDLYKETPFTFKKLKTFNVVHDHNNWTHGFPYIRFDKLENFQISLGCNKLESCDQECLELGLMRFEFGSLKRLSIIQNTHFKYNNHTNTEKWDLIVFSFIETIVETSQTLTYLSIRHNVPPDGVIDDGIDGLYLRKVKMYTNILPKLLTNIKSHVVSLVLPTLMSSLACYEQAMNTLLWIGCKCAVCREYLDRLDNYLLYHRYFIEEKGVFKDLQTPQLVRCISEVLSDRMEYDHNVGDLFQLYRPMQNTTWNFHNNKFTIPFRCLPAKTYEISEMEDEAQEAAEGKEKFFDALDLMNDCEFLHKEKFAPFYTTVIAHYIDDLVRKMVHLNRGNAEDVDMALSGEIYDGYSEMRIKKMIINGMDYNFDHELNGTIRFTNSYDTYDL